MPTVNGFLAKHLREFSSDIAEGRFDKTTDIVKNLTGHEPRTFQQYIEENKEVFENGIITSLKWNMQKVSKNTWKYVSNWR